MSPENSFRKRLRNVTQSSNKLPRPSTDKILGSETSKDDILGGIGLKKREVDVAGFEITVSPAKRKSDAGSERLEKYQFGGVILDTKGKEGETSVLRSMKSQGNITSKG